MHNQVAVYYLPGTLVGCLLGGWFGDKYGRIKTIALASVWAIIGATLQCSSENANWMFCGEFHLVYIRLVSLDLISS